MLAQVYVSDIHARLNHQEAPPDALVISVRAREAISRPFDVVVDFATGDPNLDLTGWLWSTASVEIYDSTSQDEPRCFHGVVEEAWFVGTEANSSQPDGRLATYRLRLRPHVHGLTYRVRSRIFQGKNVVDVVKTTFSDSGIAEDTVEWRTQGTYPPLEYTVQWRESELDHVRRRLEANGIFFFFEHDPAGHRLVFADQPFKPEPIAGESMLQVWARSAFAEHEPKNIVFDLTFRTQVTHDAFQSRDWDYNAPEAPRQAEAAADGRFPRYEFPGGYVDQGEGARLAQLHLDEDIGRRYGLDGRTTSLCFSPGRTMTLMGSVPAFLDDDYMLESVEHHYSHVGFGADGSLSDASRGRFYARFLARKKSEPYRPVRTMRVPSVTGYESAVVTGPSGEEIHVDEMGRVKVHFYWDRENPVDDTASCWLRVQQMNTSGSMILPRIGWEVWVAFLNGDPDRPVALLKAYNRETMPPYGLPDNMTQSALQSSTSPGGGSVNEIRLQDGNGGMDWSLNASKDLNVKALNNSAETIGVDSSETVGATSNVVVGASDDITIGANQSISVAGTGTVEATGSKSVSVGATDDWGTTGSFSVTCDGTRDETIGGLMNVVCNSGAENVTGDHDRTVGAVQALVAATAIAETVGGSKSETVSAAKVEILGANHEEDIGGLKTLNTGLLKIDAGKDITMAAKGAITVNSAGAIKIDAGADVTIDGTVITIIGPGGVTVKGGGGELTLNGTTVTVDASKFGGSGGPQLEVKGPIDYNS